ncbi:MAG: PEGA domain-containing protein [Planctomycetota bacterium]
MVIPRPALLILSLLILTAAGCVERKMFIASVPTEADLYLDGNMVGQTPLTLPFTHYGTREFVLRKPGFRTVRELKVMEPPEFQEFPWDIYYETMTSEIYRDERTYNFVLQPVDATDTSRDVVETKMSEAKELRDR